MLIGCIGYLILSCFGGCVVCVAFGVGCLWWLGAVLAWFAVAANVVVCVGLCLLLCWFWVWLIVL